MQMRQPSSTGSVSNSPGLPDRPQSVENPLTPRTPHTPHTPYTPQNNQQGGESSQENDSAGGGGGGGNPNNPANPLPLPVMFGRFGYFKLGLRGGSPMWSVGAGYGRGGRRNDSRSNDEKRGSSSGSHQEKDVGESTSGSKVEGQAESKITRQSCSSGRETRGGVITPAKSVAVVSTVASLVCVDYNDFDDENSHTPPLTPPLPHDDRHRVTSGSLPVDSKAENIPAVAERITEQDLASTKKLQESPSEKPSNQDETEREISNNAKDLIEEKCSEEIEVAIMSQEDILGSDTVVSSDLPVESLGVEETDCGNVVVFEHLSESDLAQVSSSIDTDIIEECIVTSSDIVMDMSVVDALESCEKLTSCIQKDDDEVLHLVEEENKAETGDVDDGLGGIELADGGDDIPNMDMDVMHMLDTGVRGVLDRDPVLDMPEGCREIHSMNERLRIGIVRSLGPLQQEKIVAMTDTPESPDQEEMNVDPSPEPYLPTPDTIKDDEDDMMPMIHDDPDMMELDETSGTEVDNDANETEAAEMNVTSSAEVAASGSTASVDTAGENSGETLSTHTGSSEEAGKRDHPFGVPLATQLPPSSFHQANIGVPGPIRTIVTYPTIPSLAMPTASYTRGKHLLNEEQSNASATTVAAVSAVISSAVTRQVTSVVPSVVSVPCTMPFSLDSESVEASPLSAARGKTQESSHISSISCLTSPCVASAVVTQGTEITVSSEAGLITSECSTAVAHMPQSIIGVSPTFSIITSSSPRRASVLQGSSGSTAVPVCIIRSQSGGSINANSTTVSIISSAVASTVTSSRLSSATVASLVADAVSAARLPYPPASVGQQLPFTKTGVVPVMTFSPAGVSVIANASSVSRESESLVPPPRMSTAQVTRSLTVSPNVPVTVETDSSSIPVVETVWSSDEHQTVTVQNSSPANIRARVERKSVDIAAASQMSDPRKEDTETMIDAASKLSQVTRPSMLETTNQNLVNELPLQSQGTEMSSVQVIQKPLVKVDVDDDDEILMKTVQLIFQESRPSVLATADRASSVPSQRSTVAVQEETVASEVGSSKWQCNTPMGEGVSLSETQLAVPVFNSSVTDKECKKDLTITEKLLHQYSLPSSSSMSAEPDKREQTKLDYDNSDKSSAIPTQTNAADTQNLLSTSQIKHSTNLKVPLQAVDSAMPSQTQTVMDVVNASVTSVFSQAAACTTGVETALCGQSGAAALQPFGQSMLQSRLTTGAHQMAGRFVSAPVPSPSVVMTSRLSSTIVPTGQAAASAVKQYVAYTQQQAASQTSPVITGVSKSSAVVSISPQLLTQSAPRLSTQISTNVLAPSLPAEQSVQSSILPSRVLESQSSEIVQQTQVSVPLVAIQHTATYGGGVRTASGDVCVQQPVEAASLSGRLGGDVPISVRSGSVASSGDSNVDSSKCTTFGYPYASSAPPRIQSSSSVYTRVMQPQRRMSTGELKPEEPARSCQFEQVATVKTETSESCLLKNMPVPTIGFTMQQQQQVTAVVTSISKPVAASSTFVSRTPVAVVTPKSETQHLASSCKFSSTTQASTLPLLHRIEESQNVLLKQLLQNTGCAQQTSTSTHHQSLPVVPSLEAQLARPVPPTPSSLLPSLLTNDSPLSQPPKNPQTSRPSQLTTHETSFISRPSPPVSTSPSTPFVCQQQQTPYSERRPGPPSRTPSGEDVLSPPAPSAPRVSAIGADSSHHTPSPLTSPPSVVIKKETVPPQQSPVHPVSSGDVKKEIVSDDSAVPLASEKKEFNGKIEQPSRDEMGDVGMETGCDKTTQDQAAQDIKKIKRRLYQQKRRQSQGKEPAGSGGTPKKQRVRKVSGSKVDEDYDTYIENLMMQLRQLPPMNVLEPALSRNYAVCSIFGSGDLTKIGTSRDYSTRQGDLKGTFGAAHVSHVSDHYNTQPFGGLPPLPPQPPVSTQRGFYDQEFAALKLENDDDKKQDLQAVMNRDHDNDTPDTVISSSSPECVIPEFPIRFPGLKLIEEEDAEKEEDARWLRRASPIVPIISPIPIRPRPGMQIVKEMSEVDKENVGVSRDHIQLKTRFGVSPPAPLRDAGNVTVTLTLTSAAAEDILGVLRNLANILSIPAPSGYQIVERTSTPPSQKLGLYRTKGKDGKEGAPIDIQSILNGAAKFCRHCDVVILSNLIRKKASELPFLAKDDSVENGDDLYFCSSTCYMQFALMHRFPSISEDKAAAIVDHLSQTTPSAGQKKVHPSENAERTKKDESIKEKKEEDEKMDVEQQQDEIKVEQDVAEKDESAETQAKEADCVSVKPELPVNKPEPEPTPAAAVTTPQSTTPPRVTSTEKKSRRHTGDDPASHCPPPAKVWKGLKYKYWSPGALQPSVKYKRPTDKEITEMLFRMGITMTPAKIPDDTRKCMFCHQIGDGVADGPARLLNFDVDKWVHLNCALWSDDVYETVNGALMNLENSLQQSLVLNCVVCHRTGATIRCFKLRCSNVYHLGCAVKDGCVFFKNKSTYCAAHIPKNEKDNELTTLSVFRRVYVNRDENRQVATVMHQDHNNLLRVGSLIFLSVGQLLPHQLQAFHTPNYIYPIGYKIVRFYWSMRVPNKRCRYVCSIHDVAGRPEFRVLVQEPCQDDLELRDTTPRAVWARILEPLATLRKEMGGVQVFPRYISGEDLFGLTEPAVVRVLESLPGVETLTDYRFKYGRNPLLELPLAVNPTGCARTEPKLRNQFLWKRPHTQRTGSSSRPIFVPTATVAGEAACPYSKQFVHSKSSQYKKMKQEWRNNVYLARSKIQGLGLYAARDLERHTMVIEYIGEVIRTELSELREKQYEARNRGIYMFRLDEDRVVDATLSGGLARYINHSCNPNCVAEIVEVERDLRIIIFAKRRISRGEELAYDYKFDIEDDQHKIPCNCGAPNCRKWMN